MSSKHHSPTQNNKAGSSRGTAPNTAKRTQNLYTIIICTVCALLLIGAIIGVAFTAYRSMQQKNPANTDPATSTSFRMADVRAEINSRQVSDFTETDKVTEYVKISVAGHGDIVLRLRADVAPITVKNFQELVKDHFYDGLTFHRVISGFMIQGGDPNGDGTGKSSPIKGEFSANGVNNPLSHVRGVISMARLGNNMDSGSCQFFICHSDSAAYSLDGSYASFGYVVAGLDTVDSIAGIEVLPNGREMSKPASPVVIEKICFVTEK